MVEVYKSCLAYKYMTKEMYAKCKELSLKLKWILTSEFYNMLLKGKEKTWF